MKKKIFFLSLLSYLTGRTASPALSQEARDKNFVYLHDIDPTIIISPRYSTHENFVGRVIDGYKKSTIITTKQLAHALKKVQKAFKKDGYSLVIYDAYRPHRASTDFLTWSKDIADQAKKSHYYPRVDRARVFELGYVSERSGHSRGSTVDLTLIKTGKKLHTVREIKRTLLDSFVITFLDDGTVDMGSHFDLFDRASHTENNCIEKKFLTLRRYLKNIMEKHGFKNWHAEWWHFTLQNEPYPANLDSSYFDFEVK